MGIGASLNPGQPPKCDAVHFVQGTLGVSGATTPAQVGREPYLVPDLDASSGGESLKEILVEQSGADESGIEGRNVAEIVVVEIQFNALHRIHTQSRKVASQPRSGRRRHGVALRVVKLRGFINRKRAFVGKGVFEKYERPIDGPVHHADARATGGAVVKSVEFSAFEVYECTADHPVGAIVPRRRIRRRAAEHSKSGALP